MRKFYILAFCLLIIAGCRNYINRYVDEPPESPPTEEDIKYALEEFTPIDRITFGVYKHIIEKILLIDDEFINKYHIPVSRFDQIVSSPAILRFKFLRIKGVALKISPVPLEQEINGINKTWAVVIGDGDSIAVVHVLSRPPLLYLRQDMVEVDGYLVKIAKIYTTDKREILCPFLIARRLRGVI